MGKEFTFDLKQGSLVKGCLYGEKSSLLTLNIGLWGEGLV